MYKLAALSDLHLGSDLCLCKDLDNFLDYIFPLIDELVLIGDVFESLDFTRLKKRHWKILSKIRKWSDKKRIVWVVGNHDGPADFISHLLGVKVYEYYIFKDMLFIHGHQWDDFIVNRPVLTAIGDWIYGLIKKFDRNNFLCTWLKRISKEYIKCLKKVEKGATNKAIELGCRKVLTGHTHYPTSSIFNGIEYYNSGSWTEFKGTYLLICNDVIKLKTYE